MSNLIGRLRDYRGGDVSVWKAMEEAADEITRLTAENKKLRAALQPFADAARPHKKPTPDFARALEVYDSTALQQEVK